MDRYMYIKALAISRQKFTMLTQRNAACITAIIIIATVLCFAIKNADYFLSRLAILIQIEYVAVCGIKTRSS